MVQWVSWWQCKVCIQMVGRRNKVLFYIYHPYSYFHLGNNTINCNHSKEFNLFMFGIQTINVFPAIDQMCFHYFLFFENLVPTVWHSFQSLTNIVFILPTRNIKRFVSWQIIGGMETKDIYHLASRNCGAKEIWSVGVCVVSLEKLKPWTTGQNSVGRISSSPPD